ncbi:hypothetical protein DFJ43DRAFT_986982 [Lentinula guzmanii]|uniref:FAD/NAD(P)-binding domain-containing protein n=1 Tax=Lentinula guzmanii TaxID=2804957 RepID=A0AA38N520_9AGAR|nr:hypothetical protein DFJ43DRAFT_986982 [Lentinula guzmanii]
MVVLQLLIGIGLLYGLLLQAWKLGRWYLLKYHSGIPEIESLRKTVLLPQKLDGTAVICGGSIAGLLAARVCSDFFKSVIIVEPEERLTGEDDSARRFGWEQEQKRTRVMQYRSLHGFLALFYKGLRELFPDLDEQCQYSDIAIYPADRNMNFAGTPIPAPVKSYGGQLPKTIRCSRAALETFMRRLVLARGSYPEITQIAGTAIGVSPNTNNPSRIGRVKIRKADGRIEELDASLVVDCTGIARAGFKWLSQSGYGSSTEVHPGRKQELSLRDAKISFNQKLQYSTLTYKVSPDIFSKLSLPNLENGFAEDNAERGRRVFGISQGNDNQVILFAGQSSDETVKFDSIHAMRELVQDLKMYKDPIPQWVFETLDILEECQPEILYSYVSCPPTTYIQYHRVESLPSNFVAIGDSTMTSKLISSQGCTKGLLGAVVLHAALSSVISHQELPADFSKRFFKDNFNKTNIYLFSVFFTDYGIPCTTPLPGEDLRSGSLIRWYLRKILILGTKDAQAARVCWDGGNGLGTSIDIFHPWLVLKVFLSTII